MFDNAVLDKLSRVHPAVPPLIYGPVIATLLFTGARDYDGIALTLQFALGYLLWTLIEYWGHRLLFHYHPRNWLGARLHWIIHGVHHDHPNDPLRLVMPPAMSLPIMLAAYSLLAVTVGMPGAYGIMAGVLAGYLTYDMLHYHLHHRRPRTRVGRLLRQLHMHHHFHDETVCFGVSAPWWDRVFGTMLRQK